MAWNRVCPGCKSAMNEINKNWVQVDECQSCGWMFFDYEELYTSTENINAPASMKDSIMTWDDKPEHSKDILLCSSCGSVMGEKEYLYDSWVHINFCDNCHSVFLDKGELEDIRAYVSSLETTEVWKDMTYKGLKIYSDVMEQESETSEKLKKEVDNMYFSDNYTWLDKVVNFIMDRIWF